MAINWFKYSAPTTFYGLAGKMIPWFAISAAILFGIGLYIGFFVAPMDETQGEFYRIMFIHVPASILSMFLYLGFIALHASIDEPRRADRAAALLAIVGSVNVPIIYFSVKWWNTLHQGSTIKFTGTSMQITMQHTLLAMTLACWLYAIAVVLARVRSIILERERKTVWINELPEVRS